MCPFVPNGNESVWVIPDKPRDNKKVQMSELPVRPVAGPTNTAPATPLADHFDDGGGTGRGLRGW